MVAGGIDKSSRIDGKRILKTWRNEQKWMNSLCLAVFIGYAIGTYFPFLFCFCITSYISLALVFEIYELWYGESFVPRKMEKEEMVASSVDFPPLPDVMGHVMQGKRREVIQKKIQSLVKTIRERRLNQEDAPLSPQVIRLEETKRSPQATSLEENAAAVCFNRLERKDMTIDGQGFHSLFGCPLVFAFTQIFNIILHASPAFVFDEFLSDSSFLEKYLKYNENYDENVGVFHDGEGGWKEQTFSFWTYVTGARGFFFGRHAFNEVTAKAAVIGSTLYIIKTTRVSNIRFADDFILHHVWSLDEVHGGCRLNSSLGVEWINVPRTNWYKNKVETAALEKTCEEEMKFLEFINHQID